MWEISRLDGPQYTSSQNFFAESPIPIDPANDLSPIPTVKVVSVGCVTDRVFIEEIFQFRGQCTKRKRTSFAARRPDDRC